MTPYGTNLCIFITDPSMCIDLYDSYTEHYYIFHTQSIGLGTGGNLPKLKLTKTVGTEGVS